MQGAVLLITACAAYLLPEHLALIHGSQGAWEYVLSGVEGAVLWITVGTLTASATARVVCAWGALEAGETAMCRLILPMDTKPVLKPGQTLCDVAINEYASWMSLVFAAVVAYVLAGRQDGV